MSISPASPQTITVANVTADINTTGYVDFTIGRPAFGSPTLRVVFTATAANRTSDSDAVDVPSQERDTQSLSMRMLRVSETSTQIVARVEVISPNAGATVTLAYNAGGLTITPASGGTLTSTTAFGTTAHIDYTITKDVFGGTQRRVTFTASAVGFIDATDGVDVPPADAGTKTMRVTHAAFTPVDDLSFYSRDPGYTQPRTTAGSGFLANLVFPLDVIIIAFRAHWYLKDSSTTPNHGLLRGDLLRVTGDGAVSTISTFNATKGTPVTWATDASGTLSEVASSGRQYIIRVITNPNSSGSAGETGDTTRFSWFEIDYTMAGYAQTI